MLSHKIAKNFTISAIGRISSFALALVIVGYLSRYLGASGFGNYSTILAFVYIFTVIADLGLYQVGLRDISKIYADEKKIISLVFSLRLFWGLIVFSSAPLIAYVFPYSLDIKVGVAIAALGFWFLSNSQVLISIFQKYLKTQYPAIVDVISRVIQLAVLSFFIFNNSGFYSVVLAMVIGAATNFFLLLWFARKIIAFNVVVDFQGWRGLVRDSLPLAVAGILTMLYFKFDTVILSLLKPAFDVGIYSLAYRILESLIFFPLMFVGLVMPQMMKFLSSGDDESYRNITQKTLNILILAAVPMVFGGCFFAKNIVLLVGGSDFLSASVPLDILLLATAIIFIGALLSNIIIVLHRQKSLIYIYGAGAIFNLITNLIFIPRYSYTGAALTTLATELLVTMLMAYVVSKAQGYFFSFKITTKSLMAGLIMLSAIYILNYLFPSFILGLVVAVLIYVIAIYLVGAINRQDISSIVVSDES